ncbi:MAG: sensor protein [Firmicutes bacterium]|nr:sensor protein [Bacillota bacterium]
MYELGNPSRFSNILAEIRKLADEALKLSESRRLHEHMLSDEIIQLSEKRRLSERDHSDAALGVAEEAFNISEKRRLIERAHSDQAFTLEEKRRLTEHKQATEALNLQHDQSSLEVSLAHQEIDKLNRQIIKILENMHETCLFFYDYRLIYLNAQTRNLYWSKENIIGKTLGELIPKNISEAFLQTYQNDATAQSLIRFESEEFQNNKCFQFFFYPSDSGFLVCINDITRAKQIEKELIQKDKLKK